MQWHAAWALTVWRMLNSRDALFSVAAAVLAAVVIVRWSRRRSAEVHARGAVVADAALRTAAMWPKPAAARAAGRRFGAMCRRTRRAAQRTPVLTVAGLEIPGLDESKHFKMLGTTGTGKSTAIAELLAGALARGDRAVFADPDGGYVRRFFRRYRGDTVLNPFEPGSVTWDPLGEIDTEADIEQLSTGLIPSSEDASSAEWRAYARTFLSAVLRRCRFDGRSGTQELWRLIAVAPVEELRRAVAGTPAMPFLEPDNARMFGSIRSVAVSAMAALEHVQVQRSVPFSVRRWVRGVDRSGMLFIPYKAGQIAALRALIATWMRLAIFEAMSGDPRHDLKLWFVVDELDALGAIEGLKDALARLRKFGGRCVLGFQSIAQVSGIYGAAAAQTIVENCGNTLILRCAGSENGGTSQFASKLIGEREVVRRQTSRGSDRDVGFSTRGARRSKTISEQRVTETAVMASQIEQLPDLCGYFKLASSPVWRKVAFGDAHA